MRYFLEVRLAIYLLLYADAVGGTQRAYIEMHH